MLFAQNIKIDLGADRIAQNQYFTITITANNERIKSYDAFPEIKGFQRQHTGTSMSSSFINGTRSLTYSITQHYVPTKQGTFRLKPFKMKVNDQTVASNGTTIEVSAPKQRRRRNDPFSMFDDFFNQQEESYEQIDAEAYLSLHTDKNEIYEGEGVLVSLGFFIEEQSYGILGLPGNINEQLNEIYQLLHPKNALEELFDLPYQWERVTVGNKRFIRFTLHQAMLYPFTNEDLVLPSIQFEMQKFKISQGFFRRKKRDGMQTFKSKAKTIRVKPLPPHPLKDQVSVGQFTLNESTTPNDQFNTGESIHYIFEIKGEGNFSTIAMNEPTKDTRLEIYTPDIHQQIQKAHNKVLGTKRFSYDIIPNEPGTHILKDYFSWIYFDPKQAHYDTLISQISLQVAGESLRDHSIASSDLGDFYNQIPLTSNHLVSIDTINKTFYIGILFALVMLVTMILFFVRKKTD